ncbi:sigma factor [Xenorhabdus koppenhoeferi]|uniref:sigma factor n=1 Tax=Xenorhabdus koppenhoeferi TaxID=351659 RepID=UPI002B416789|nr:sigma factor [Xenorhabdus sp. Vera]
MMEQKSTFGHHEMAQQLYSEYYEWLLSWIKQNCASPNHAEDLTHDIFIKLMQLPEPNIRYPKAFLITIARRTVANYYRRKKLEDNYLEYVSAVQKNTSYPSEHQLVLLE